MKTRLSRGALRAAFALLATLTPATLVFGAPGEVSFTPSGFKVSIMKIALSIQSEGGAPGTGNTGAPGAAWISGRCSAQKIVPCAVRRHSAHKERERFFLCVRREKGE